MTCGFEEDHCSPLGAVALLYPLPRCRRPSQAVQIRSAVDLSSVAEELIWLGNHQAADESVLSRICGRCLMEPQSALKHCFNCSATATISYPASLSNLPNGCQGHPRFYPPPDRSPITKPDSNYVLTRCNFYSTIGMG